MSELLRMLPVLAMCAWLTAGCAREQSPWDENAIMRDVLADVRRFDRVPGDLRELRLLMWQIEQDPARNLVVHESLMWGRISEPDRSDRWVLVVAYRHPQDDNQWHPSVGSAEVLDQRHPHTRLGYRQYDHPPTSAEICEFLGHLQGPSPDGFRQQAGAFLERTWQRVAGAKRVCEFDGTPPPPLPAEQHCPVPAEAFRSGVEPPELIRRVEPDFSGVTVPSGERLVIVQAVVGTDGRVLEACMLRGLGEAIDARALGAVRQWQFEAPRLKSPVAIEGRSLRKGTAVPVVLTVTVRVAPH